MSPTPQAGKRRRRALPLVLALAAVVAAAGLWLNWDFIAGDPDDRIVSFERWKRRSAFTAGYTLPGTPDLARLDARLSAVGVSLADPILMRIFKREFELELWKKRGEAFELFATYPICRWSGRLGPKLRTGDRQAPEGFYTVDAGALNPNSRWHRSFNLGFPNTFDRSHGRTGSFLMVHGGCSSVGCYAMTDPVIDEIWTLVTAALDKGQDRFQVQVFPFRMTEENMTARAGHPQAAFWRSLKHGYDLFEADRLPPKVSVCNRQYSFERGAPKTSGDSPIASRCAVAKPS